MRQGIGRRVYTRHSQPNFFCAMLLVCIFLFDMLFRVFSLSLPDFGGPHETHIRFIMYEPIHTCVSVNVYFRSTMFSLLSSRFFAMASVCVCVWCFHLLCVFFLFFVGRRFLLPSIESTPENAVLLAPNFFAPPAREN